MSIDAIGPVNTAFMFRGRASDNEIYSVGDAVLDADGATLVYTGSEWVTFGPLSTDDRSTDHTGMRKIITCPQCGGALPDSDSETVRCVYCDCEVPVWVNQSSLA